MKLVYCIFHNLILVEYDDVIEYPRMHFQFGGNLMISAQLCDKLSRQQPKFPGILRWNDQMTLKVNDHHFQYHPREAKYLVQIWGF